MRPRKNDRHLPACVFLRHSSYYLVKKGKWTRIGGDLRSALVEYARLENIQAETLSGGGGMQKLIEDALPHICKGKKPETKKLYEASGRKLQVMLAQYSPRDVTSATVAKLRRALADTPSMANRCLSVLRLVFEVALEDETVEFNPVTGVKGLEVKGRKRLIKPSEYIKIRKEAPPHLQAMMDLAYLTGQRMMDVAHITRAQLQDDGIYFKQGKTDKELEVRWTPELREVVATIEAMSNVKAPTLFHTRGKPYPYRTLNNHWNWARDAAGLKDINFQDIRAMSATAMKKQSKAAGQNSIAATAAAQALLGHTSPRMTQRYLRDLEVETVDGPRHDQRVLDSIGRAA